MEKIRSRFAGISTFMNAPYVIKERGLDDIDIGFVGVPYDMATTNVPGARLGPKALREQSPLMGDYDYIDKIEPFKLFKIADLGDVVLEKPFSHESVCEEIYLHYRELKKKNIIPISVGGDHSITYPILKALGEAEPLAVIHFDAHCDTISEIWNSKLSHASPFRNATDDHVIDPKSTIQIGIRGFADKYWGFSKESGMHVLHIDECENIGMDGVIAKIREVVEDKPTYLSFDVDSLDPVYAPGTGTPEIGGFTSREVLTLLRGCRGLNIVGADVVEVSPPLDLNNITALLGVTLMFEILCIICEQKSS